LKRSSASAFASSVFHTHVGQTNKNDQIGLFSSLSQALARRIALLTVLIASCCHTTLLCKNSSRCDSFSCSDCVSAVAGIHVRFATTCAMSSAVTLSDQLGFTSCICSSSFVI